MGRLNGRAIAVALTVFLVGASAAMVAGSVGPGTADVPATPAATEMAPTESTSDHTGDADPAARLECTNGTSPAVVDCGYNPGPTAVELADQRATDSTVTVRAADLESDGFVAIHRVSFVDGAFTESVIGVSEPLSAGLHRDVEVGVEKTLNPTTEYTLIAVVYEDSDGDDTFDFVTSDGADDRPFTNTYSERGGNVSDEAGDVIGDAATISVSQAPVVVPGGPPAASLDDDSLLEDVDGDGDADIFDAMAYYNNRNSAAIQNNPAQFDFDGDGDVGTIFDAVALYNDSR